MGTDSVKARMGREGAEFLDGGKLWQISRAAAPLASDQGLWLHPMPGPHC